MKLVTNLTLQFRLTMAAIDPTEEPEVDAGEDKQRPRATLKVVRVPEDMIDDSDDDEDDFEDDDEDSEEEGVNGGPSDKKKSKLDKIVKAEEDEDMDEDDEDDSDEDEAAKELLAKLMANGSKKGKSKALDGDDDEDSDIDSLEALGMDEVVMCTLDPEKVCSRSLLGFMHLLTILLAIPTDSRLCRCRG